MIASIEVPPVLRIGGGAVGELPGVLAELGVTRPLLVTDPVMVELGHADRVTELLRAADVPHAVFHDTEPEPSEGSVLRGVAAFRAEPFDGLVALGGGSAIDSAKAIGVLARHGGSIRDHAVPNEVTATAVPLVAIPTTAGTGSECTRFTVITDEVNGEKLLCRGRGFLPAAALVDHEFTRTAPARLSADTGIDALTHALEAYVSRRASPFTDDLALAAMTRLAANVERVCAAPEDEAARADMMLGATLAGMAFSNASVALVHGMSRPVGAFFHVPHGLSNAMLLPAVTRFSVPAARARYARAAIAMGFGTPDADDDANCEALVAGLAALNRRLEVPGPAAWGIDRDAWFTSLPTMAEQALASGSPANNPRVPTTDEMIALYTEVWGNA